MQIQINTDRTVESNEALDAMVHTTLNAALDRYESRLHAPRGAPQRRER